VDLEKIELEKK